ncbi:cAMP-dependent protein kinase regulatory subunit [Penicillium taxi]|uniref:cAMP-dependent protein kinase regulatory subunit n=1 Tax=Penicillium taxi TaxID=168475 RepID=UPI002545142D|nr:cAMP-dependent protein kinase regulatory subunit [Penicillium taxi]KAJ5888113.1 cAMP-dependent protein kinase regulatory subunit [Penicillium taxi]
MAETSPFISTDNLEKSHRIQKISEEDEFEVTSPTDMTFRAANAGDSARKANFGGSTLSLAGSTASGSSLFSRSPFDEGPGSGAGSDGVDELGAHLHPESAQGGMPSNYALGRRTSVSAESLNPTSAGSESWAPPHHPKTDEQLARLKTAVSSNFLFAHLEDEQFKTVLDALVEKPIPAKGIKVISQGDAGDYFYIVEHGSFDIYIHPLGSVQPGPDGMGNKVGSTGPGGSFGELALMYNSPRAATVISIDAKSTLWALDRITFRRILMDSAFQRRRMYEEFLEEVPVLSSLKQYERSKVADALDTIKYPANATIITAGDPGDAFYLLESGEAEAILNGVSVKTYHRGDYFGELALLDDKPRAASVITKTEAKVARLGRDGFKRLLGPVEEILRRTEYIRHDEIEGYSK